jgi:hypothetical protein
VHIPLTGTLFKLPSLSTHEFAAVVIAAVFARRLCLGILTAGDLKAAIMGVTSTQEFRKLGDRIISPPPQVDEKEKAACAAFRSSQSHRASISCHWHGRRLLTTCRSAALIRSCLTAGDLKAAIMGVTSTQEFRKLGDRIISPPPQVGRVFHAIGMDVDF